jgi:hypothetical protein
VAVATAGWAIAFAGLSAYWAAGGTALSETIGPAVADHVRSPSWVAFLWATAGLKLLVGVLGLAFVYPLGRVVPLWVVLAAGVTAVTIVGLYEGLASLVQHILMVSGVIATPAGLGSTAARWHVALWDPIWLAGGVLLALGTWSFWRRTAAGKDARTLRARA